MKITLLVIVLCIAAAVQSLGQGIGDGNGPENGKGNGQDDRFGMEENEYKELKKCLKKIRIKSAQKHGKTPGDDIDDSIVSGDIVFTLRQCQDILKGMTEEKGNKGARKKRVAIDFTHPDSIRSDVKWSIPIHYEFYEYPKYYPEAARPIVNFALSNWESQTCLRFKAYNPQVEPNTTPRMKFLNSNGCWSKLGKQPSSQFQFVSIAVGGCVTETGTSVHEIGHALGLYHQQSRGDRDLHITMNWNNIRDDKLFNFEVLNFEDERDPNTWFGVPYDLGSIMHYSAKAFAVNCSLVTMGEHAKYSQYTMGQSVKASFMDAKVMNFAYCNGTCTNALAQSCQNGGYQDPNHCYRCKCPEGLGGDFCEGVGDQSMGCTPAAGTLTASGVEQCIMSPNYGSGSYDVGAQCNWKIQAPVGKRVKAYFKAPFNVYCEHEMSGYGGPNCVQRICSHWVEIKYKADKQQRGGRFCCPDSEFNNPGKVFSENEEMVVHFDASYPQISNSLLRYPSATSRQGFKLCFVEYSCKTTRSGREYAGNIAQTVSGKTCQRWDAQYPHVPTNFDIADFPEDNYSDASNYCRNPDKNYDPGPWCYTTDPNTRAERCDIDLCSFGPQASYCLNGATDVSYSFALREPVCQCASSSAQWTGARCGYAADACTTGGANLTAPSGVIHSHDTYGYNNYANNLDCSWSIEVAEGMAVSLTINSFDLDSLDVYPYCKYDVVRIYDSSSSTPGPHWTYCDDRQGRMPNVTISTGRRMYITFTTDEWDQSTGFEFTWESVPVPQ